MKNFGYLIKILVVSTMIVSCGKKVKTPVIIDKNLLDTIFVSTYDGTIPCPDCPGIETTIRIYKDSTISRTIYYQDKNDLPETKVGTWKLKDSIFEATFDREKLFYRIKDASKILRVGSDFKEVKGEFANDYTLRKRDTFLKNSLNGVYIAGDTLNLSNTLEINHIKKDDYQISLKHFNRIDSLQNCTTQLNAKIDKNLQLVANLNKKKEALRIIFTRNNAHIVFSNTATDSILFKCNDTLRFVPFNGTYKKEKSTL